jgi:hypothetical protein
MRMLTSSLYRNCSKGGFRIVVPGAQALRAFALTQVASQAAIKWEKATSMLKSPGVRELKDVAPNKGVRITLEYPVWEEVLVGRVSFLT